MLRELSEAECDEILRRHRFGRVGVRDAKGVYIVPIGYAIEGGAIYAHAAPGHKVHLMRLWPHVAFEVDEIEDGAHWRSVLVRGRFEEVEGDEARQHARLLLLKVFDGNPVSVTAGHGHRTHLADAVLFRIRMEEVTGRSEGL